ncbi:hypothetical protein Fmac_024240 [Flemingia macrophylla]|uniref:Transposase IS200-like domain-containing protein n=1 Tax=Flemingia macrophylla TaxID=520843 RepID=A0ABD1LNT3_9FABA
MTQQFYYLFIKFCDEVGKDKNQIYCDVFQPFLGLLSHCVVNHHIHLIIDTKLVNVWPFKYPYFKSQRWKS